MDDLPAVKDDHSNMLQTVEMMNIPKENVYERIDASWKDMEELDNLVN